MKKKKQNQRESHITADLKTSNTKGGTRIEDVREKTEAG